MRIGRYIIGLLSGLTFGMLFAPKSGKKLRTEIIKKGSVSSQDALAAFAMAFRDAGKDAIDEMKKLTESEQIQAAVHMSKDKMREYLSHLEETGYDVAATAQEKLEELSDVATKQVADFKKRAVKKHQAVKKAVKKRISQVKKAAKTKPKAKPKTVRKAVKKAPSKKVAPKKVTPKKKGTRKKK